MAWHLFDTPIGWCGLAWNEGGLAGLQLPEKDRAATERRLRARDPTGTQAASPPAWVARLIADLQRYLAGERINFSAVAVDFGRRDANEQAIYAALRAVAWGETVTYGELAKRSGIENGAQAVGQAMARNPVPVVVPCHRVLAAGQRIGGFSAPGGAATKERLLALEGVRLDAGMPRLPGL